MKSQRSYLSLFVVLVLATVFSGSTSAHAQTDIYIRGSGKLFPIALPRLCAQSGESTAPQDIPNIIARDLDLSGYFEVLNPNAYIETPGKCVAPDSMAYSDWTVIGAEGLVRGIVTAQGDSLKVQLYLHDVQRQKVVLGKEYEGDPSQIRKIAHRFANEIMKFFTGEYGVFGTQISFSSKVGRFKELFVMDMDGSNVRQLTNDRGLALSSSWDNAGANLLFTSYRSRVPDLFVMNVGSKRLTQLTRDTAMELGGKYSLDGTKILSSRTIDGEADILLYNTDGSIARKLTSSNGAIDVSPDWSPDNSQIVFCSNRAGGPQIYVMNSDGSGARRISFVTSNYCTSPSWSPKGDKIAFVCRADRGFNLFVANADGSDPMQLTSQGDNEDPDWSPDGRYITFSSTSGHPGIPSIVLMRADGTNMRPLTSSRIGDSQPSWGPLGD